MKYGKFLTAAALGASMAFGGIALAGSKPESEKTMGTQQTLPSDKGSAARDDVDGSKRADTMGANWYREYQAGDLIGRQVRNQAGEEVGEIDKLVVDNGGEYHAVVSVGGFLGIGDKQVAIPLDRMQLGEEEALLLSAQDEEQLEAMPAYDEDTTQFDEVTRRDQHLGQ